MISVEYFLLTFAHVSYLPTSTKGGLGFFILFFGFELLANIKKDLVSTHSLKLFLLITQNLNKIKKITNTLL